MKSAPQQGPLPDYTRPPVVEVILGVQFNRLPGFPNAHLGAFWKTLDTNEWTAVSDAPPLEPQFERFAESARWAMPQIQLRVTQDLSNRVLIKNKDGDRMIQVQNGRFHFNWLGHAGGPYPRYQNVRKGFSWALERFLEFIDRESIKGFQPNQWEVTYLNAYPHETLWKTSKDWEFFRPLGGCPNGRGDN